EAAGAKARRSRPRSRTAPCRSRSSIRSTTIRRERDAMAEPVASVSVLDPLAARMAGASWPGAPLAARAPGTQVGARLRGEAAARAASALGLDTPPGPNRVAAGHAVECLWLGPEEWLVVGSLSERASLRQVLERAVGPDDGAVVDLSSARVVLELSG